jgi:hypothetical protein
MELRGQIHRDTPFGEMLYTLALDTNYTYYLEVGTWRGYGTTKCVMDGLVERTRTTSQPIHFYSLESNKDFFNEAFHLWMRQGHAFLHLLFGKLHENGLMDREEIEAHPYFGWIRTHYDIWYDQDVIDYNFAPRILPNSLPPRLDVVVLDGGEFSGYADWLALKEREPRVVCLDDTNVMKNERVFKELSENKEEWELRAHGDDRHGWAIFYRRCLNK